MYTSAADSSPSDVLATKLAMGVSPTLRKAIRMCKMNRKEGRGKLRTVRRIPLADITTRNKKTSHNDANNQVLASTSLYSPMMSPV